MSDVVFENRKFSYRCITKEFTKFDEAQIVTRDFHLERGEHDEVVIVEDRKRDWVEIAQQDCGKVGLANILKLAAKGQVNLADCKYDSDKEGGADISGLNVMDPESIKAQILAIDELTKKVQELQKQIEQANKPKGTEGGAE